MAQSSDLSKIFNTVLPFSDFLYILQQEEYSSRRLIKWLPRFFFRRNFQVRDHLKYTKRIKLTLGLILALWLGTLLGAAIVVANPVVTSLLVIAWLIAIPVFVLVGNLLISPYFERIKRRIRNQATAKVMKLPKLKIVAVAGSYGKTTVKNFVFQLVQYNYRTQMIPGNINTPAGIADWLSRNLRDNTELLIAEVDAYEVGEIAKSCHIIPADIAVLTNVGDQHLERFGSETELAKALSEVFSGAKQTAHLITTAETMAKLPKFNQEQQQLHILKANQQLSYQDQAIGQVNLSASNQINLHFALQVASILNIPDRFVLDTLKRLELPDRRQRLTEMYGYQAIDDSYNISFTTAQAGIAAGRAEADRLGMKLLVMTAGIPELAPDKADNNLKLGEVLSANADHTVILGSMFAEDIARGVGKSTMFTQISNLTQFLTETTHKFPLTEWFLLVQPELGDLYY